MYVGVDIGGTKTLVGAFTNDGELREHNRFPTPSDYPNFLSELAQCVDKMSTKEFRTGCVAIPGRVDRKEGVGIAFGNLPWKRVPIQSDLEHIFGCPMLVENDANLAGLSEAICIRHQYTRILYVTVSTGIGTGIIADGKIDPDFADSEGGHIILEHDGKLQRWEDFASGRAIVTHFGKRAEDITDAKTWKIIARNLAIGLIDLIAVVQPQAIVMGGGVDSYFERLEKYLESELQRYETPLTPIPPILKAKRPEQAVVYGCYELARMAYGKHHS
ncbi:MAG TPA: ROK family protein [Candidatus Saccharimonadales bacterium]|jgi:glucokinase|nr:ROK family protein [Candidatus Saccharimonadales bacterium]